MDLKAFICMYIGLGCFLLGGWHLIVSVDQRWHLIFPGDKETEKPGSVKKYSMLSSEAIVVFLSMFIGGIALLFCISR